MSKTKTIKLRNAPDAEVLVDVDLDGRHFVSLGCPATYDKDWTYLTPTEARTLARALTGAAMRADIARRKEKP